MSRFHSSKKFQTFSTTFKKHSNITVKVSASKTKHNSHKNLDSFIYGIKQGLLKTIAKIFLWSWNFYTELLYLLVHHCQKMVAMQNMELEIHTNMYKTNYYRKFYNISGSQSLQTLTYDQNRVPQIFSDFSKQGNYLL